jgi:hypothetical protein
MLSEQENGRTKYAEHPQTVSAKWRSPIKSGSVFFCPSHGARYGVSGAALAPLIEDHPSDPCAGNTLTREFPALEDENIRFGGIKWFYWLVLLR